MLARIQRGAGQTRRLRPRGSTVAGLVVLAYLALLAFWPLIAILHRSFRSVGLDRVAEILAKSSTWSVVGFTLWQATLSAVLTLLVGLPVAHVLSRYRFAGRGALRAFVVVPFVMPTLVVAAAVRAAFEMVSAAAPWWPELGQSSLWPVLCAHVFFNLAVVVRLVGGRWSALDRRLQDGAAVLGASPLSVWRTIVFPQLRSVIVGSFVLVFMFSFTSFGVIRVLGGLRMATLETEIYRYAIARQQFDVAAVLACLQLAVVGVLSFLTGRIQRVHTASSRRATADDLVPVDRLRRVLYLGLVVGIVAVLQAFPIAMLIERSLRVGDSHGLAHYRALGTRLDLLPTSSLQAVANSVGFALLAAAIAGVMALLALWALAGRGAARLGRLLEAVVFVPLGVSAVTLGFGYLVGFGSFDLRSAWWLLPLAHSVIGLPFVLSAMVPTFRSIEPSLREAAASLGAGRSRVVATVDWPLTRGSLTTGLGFAVAVSVGEFGASSFLARGDATFTAPLAIFRLLGTPGDAVRGQAMALSVVVGVVVGLIAYAIEVNRSDEVTLL